MKFCCWTFIRGEFLEGGDIRCNTIRILLEFMKNINGIREKFYKNPKKFKDFQRNSKICNEIKIKFKEFKKIQVNSRKFK